MNDTRENTMSYQLEDDFLMDHDVPEPVEPWELQDFEDVLS